ncbi:MAG: DUF1385 domain-containing protein [Nanoarchaeota archaeon]|nr:DUF1385 domain-containing protein [Nanoarchaeota archaeon]
MEVGGQAVIEGVMMRNKEKYAVAVRLPNGKVKILKEKSSSFPKWFNVFFLRGVVGLGYALYDGVRALTWSSNQNLGKEEKLSKKEIIGTVALSFLSAIILFVGIPFFAARWLHGEGAWFNVFDGLFRAGLFLGYLLLISHLSDVKTLFQYHGAEHKTIYCYENKKELTVENVRSFSRFHPRCGTSFLFLILLLSIAAFSFLSGPLWIKLGGRILLLPVISGIGYELIKLSGKYGNNSFVKAVTAPGLWLQRITTKEPTDRQIEVGIASLKAVVE